ncbi:MAG: 30S ribosome-binding factor RbfA [Candidatus Pacebacteria bacterium]|nr:30S ribosome-binding factor RbfA [Candidatus Paceibacterota bacterium]
MINLRRIEKINELLKREIGRIFSQELDFANILITITRVDTSSNFIQAKTYISIFPEKEREKVFSYLNKNIYFFQQILNKRLKIRPVPKLIFEVEKQVQEAGRVEKTLEALKKEEK